jgi:hypothetical protein
MSKMEWAEPSGVASAFSDEQKVRVQALRIATEVGVRFRTTSMGGASTPWAADDTMALLLSLADWIVNPDSINVPVLSDQALAQMLTQNQEGQQ